jgi:tetratricopeptide (TPR) repeat protein
MKQIASLLFRAGLVAVCVFIFWQTIRAARADLASAPDTVVSLTRAVAIQPENADLVARAALLRSDSGDPLPTVDQDLIQALRLNPLNSELMIALGLRREFEGKTTEAGMYLAHAAEVDHAFRASWTYASFSYRMGQFDQFWAMAERCLHLEPLTYDPAPVFDLAWRVITESKSGDSKPSGDSKKILALLPRDGPRPVQYLNFLEQTNRAEAAIEAWPAALNSIDPSVPLDAAAVISFPDFLIAGDQVAGAVKVWNQLVDRGLIHSGHLAPDNGVSIADPTFTYPMLEKSFGWTVTHAPGAFASSLPAMMQFELDGNEPPGVTLLSALAPLAPGKSYRLVWKADSSRLSSPQDPGFYFDIAHSPDDVISVCLPALEKGGNGSCEFTIPPQQEAGYDAAHIELRYARALGTVRPKGILRLSEVRLEFAR